MNIQANSHSPIHHLFSKSSHQPLRPPLLRSRIQVLCESNQDQSIQHTGEEHLQHLLLLRLLPTAHNVITGHVFNHQRLLSHSSIFLFFFIFFYSLTLRNSSFLQLAMWASPPGSIPETQTQSGPQPSDHHLNLNTNVDLSPRISTQIQHSAFAVSDWLVFAASSFLLQNL